MTFLRFSQFLDEGGSTFSEPHRHPVPGYVTHTIKCISLPGFHSNNFFLNPIFQIFVSFVDLIENLAEMERGTTGAQVSTRALV